MDGPASNLTCSQRVRKPVNTKSTIVVGVVPRLPIRTSLTVLTAANHWFHEIHRFREPHDTGLFCPRISLFQSTFYRHQRPQTKMQVPHPRDLPFFLVFNFLKHVFPDTTVRANPVIGYFLKGGTWLNPVIWVPNFWIINVPTYSAFPLCHRCIRLLALLEREVLRMISPALGIHKQSI